MNEQISNSTNSSSRNRSTQSKNSPQGITAISVKGYKSIRDETKLTIAPLTILAGANSSGKSSLIQPLLLMKQTLEATYDPGALLLNGPNLKFTAVEQLFFKKTSKQDKKSFELGLEVEGNKWMSCIFQPNPKKLDLASITYQSDQFNATFSPDMNREKILDALPNEIRDFYLIFMGQIHEQAIELEEDHRPTSEDLVLKVIRNRCFFEIGLFKNKPSKFKVVSNDILSAGFKEQIQSIIHVPGLRGNPERAYRMTAISDQFPGTFEAYVASVVNHWQVTSSKELNQLNHFLQVLGLTSKIESKEINDTQVELTVGRLPCGSNQKITRKDMVSIADVGFGVSQTLPVLVALLVAEPGQLVYVEQPEIHLHPRAQVALAEVFAEAIRRGVRVIVETHSELFLLGIQSLVAEGKLPADRVMLHWFTRQIDGSTHVSSADLDETGAFGEWPQDFGEVSLGIQNRYLTAAEAKLWGK